jgi:hypothetical protein
MANNTQARRPASPRPGRFYLKYVTVHEALREMRTTLIVWLISGPLCIVLSFAGSATVGRSPLGAALAAVPYWFWLGAGLMIAGWVLRGQTFTFLIPNFTPISWLAISLTGGILLWAGLRVTSSAMDAAMWLIVISFCTIWILYDNLVEVGRAKYAQEVLPEKIVILLSGIPGAGKSTFGRYLSREHNFAHYDLECWPRGWPNPHLKERWDADRRAFVEELRQYHDRVVLDWGFPVSCASWVAELRDQGVQLVWLDCDTNRARDAVVRRGGTDWIAFYQQVKQIQQAGYPDQLNCLVVPVLASSGSFLNPHQIESIVFPIRE